MEKTKKLFSKTPSWALFIILLVAGGIVIWFSPAEATLGNGIKPVYIHVPLTIVAKLLLYLAAGVGVSILLGFERMMRWGWSIFRVALGMFLVGFLFSVLASIVNWGNVPLQEPRFLKSANVLVVGLAVWLIFNWVPWSRVKGAMLIVPPLFFITLFAPTTWVLHPDTAMSTAPGGIRTTFIVMIIWAALIGLWWLWYLYASQLSSADNLPE